MKLKKNGEPDQRSIKSSANMSKARSRVKEFLKAGKQIVQQSDSEDSGDEIIDLVVRKKEPVRMELGAEQEEEEDRQPIRRYPNAQKQTIHKTIRKTIRKTHQKPPLIQSDDGSNMSEDMEEDEQPKPKSQRKIAFEEMKSKHELLQLEFQELKKRITDMHIKTETERTMRKNDDIDMLRKKMILKF